MRSGAIIAAFLLATNAQAANVSIYGEWRIESGDIAEIHPCDTGINPYGKDIPNICVTLTTGPYKGSFLGSGRKMPSQAGNGSRFKGELTDPSTNRTYRGSGEVKGGTLHVNGCFLVICEKQVWRKLYSPDGKAD